MALEFFFLGCTNHEMIYLVGGPGEGRESGGFGTMTLDAFGGGTPDMVSDAKPLTPLGDFVAQDIPAGTGPEFVFMSGLDGEHSVPPRLIGEAYLVPRTGGLGWDLSAGDDGAGHLTLTVTNNGSEAGEISPAVVGTAYLRIRVKHTFDR